MGKLPQPGRVSEPRGQGADAYNGWSTYETWVVFLWLSSDPATFNQMTDMLRQASSRSEAVSLLSSWVEVANPLADVPGLYNDLLGHALQQVRWEEVALAFRQTSEISR